MQLSLKPVDKRTFTHNAANKTLIAEMSDLRGTGLQRVFDDACDEGIAIFNGDTGSITVWAVHRTEESREQEILSWVLTPTPDTLRKCPQVAGYTVILFND